MGTRQVNQFGPNDTEFISMMETINKSYKGKAEITLSNYNNDNEPVLETGSLFDSNGALIIIEDTDETPADYSLMPDDTKIFIMYSALGGDFYYTDAVPVWSDEKQGWYTSNDRALFSVEKTTGATGYTKKSLLMGRNNPEYANTINSKTVDTGQGENESYAMNQDVRTDSIVNFEARHIFFQTLKGAGFTYGAIFDKLAPYLPIASNRRMIVSGALTKTTSTEILVLSYAQISSDGLTIELYGINVAGIGNETSIIVNTGNPTVVPYISMAW